MDPSFTRHHVTREKTTVVACLRDHFGLNAISAKKLLGLGAIYHDRKRLFGDRELGVGAYLRLHLRPKRFAVQTIDWQKIILSDQNEFMVVNKPLGIPVHATLDNAVENVLHQLRLLTHGPLFVTQRLDVAVSGLLVFAKSSDFQRRFNRWLSERKISKRYLALVERAPPLGFHVHYMEPSQRSPKRLDSAAHSNWLRCELSIVASRECSGFHEMEIDLHTGRTHQIRAQLSFLGVPIFGDRLYGATRSYEKNAIALFASRLQWDEGSNIRHVFTLMPPWSEKVVSQSHGFA